MQFVFDVYNIIFNLLICQSSRMSKHHTLLSANGKYNDCCYIRSKNQKKRNVILGISL